MSLVALDPIKIIILMTCGAAFATIGLWLMFRPKPEGGAAKFEVLGLKIEAASTGLLVFLIGAGFLAVPLVVPERAPSGESREDHGPGSSGAPADASGSSSSQESSNTRLVPPRRRAAGTELEPNDDYETANQLVPGASIAGSVGFKTEDWFVVPVEKSRNTLYIKVRTLKVEFCYVHFYSAEETELHTEVRFPPEHTVASWALPLDGTAAVYVRLTNPFSPVACRYEFFTGHDPL